jgi:hypothetical protein
VDVDDTRDWFEEYVRVFEACGRGASDDISRLMETTTACRSYSRPRSARWHS